MSSDGALTLERATRARGDADQASFLEVSSAQKRMWFLHQLSAENCPYVVVQAFRLDGGTLEAGALEHALNDMAERHEMLRSNFVLKDGHPVRVVRDFRFTSLPRKPANRTVENELEERLREVAESMRLQMVDLATAPLYGFCLVGNPGSEEQHLLMSFHHIVVDGWSLDLFFRQLAQAYRSRCAGGQQDWSRAAPFQTVVMAERAYLASDAGCEALRGAAERLRDCSMLMLPTARKRPLRASFRGRQILSALPAALSSKLNVLARTTGGGSLYAVLLAVVATVLHRYSGDTDLVVGCPVANRTDWGHEESIGLFVNSVAIRIHVDPAASVVQLISDARHATLTALEFQRVPFETVVEELAPVRSLSYNPVFQVMVALQNTNQSPLRLAGLDVAPVRLDLQSCLLDLETTFWTEDGQLRLKLVYNTDIIEASVARAITESIEHVLSAVVEQPKVPVRAVPVIGDRSRLLLASFGDGIQLPEAAGGTMDGLVADQASLHPDATAVCDGTSSLSYRQLTDAAARVAASLRDRGIRTGDCVAVCLSRTVNVAVAILGVMRLGATVVSLNPADPTERKRYILEDCAAAARIAECADSALAGERVLVMNELLAGQDRGLRASHPNGAIAYLIYTSGTTGRPKGVLVEHRNAVNTLHATQQHLRLTPHDVCLVLASCTFDVFFFELFAPLLAGGAARIVSREELLDPVELAPLLQRTTFFQAVPGTMEHVLASLDATGRRQSETVRAVMTGGEAVPSTLLARLATAFPNSDVIVTYGPTEAAIFCTLWRAPRGDATVEGYPIGVPLAGVKVRICDAGGELLPFGAAGEIWIGGAGVARGYLNSPTLTAEKFVRIDEHRFYRSGDRGRWNSDGTLEFLGREDRQVKVRGFRIELGEVEATMNAVPGVAEAVAVVNGDSHAARHLQAYVVPTAPTMEAARAAAERGRSASWYDMFQAAYAQRTRYLQGNDDFTGWISRVDGEPIPLTEMDEWVEASLQQILARLNAARSVARDLRVLEIGCGTGLVLRRLAPLCRKYVGTDISEHAIADLRRKLGSRDHIELRVGSAEHLGTIGGNFDVVVLNSVVQYFPSQQYLQQVLRLAMAKLAEGGFVYVGDVRSLATLRHFSGRVAAARAPEGSDLMREAARLVDSEMELVVYPSFFRARAQECGAPGHIECMPRRGKTHSEMTVYRYDAVLHKAPRDAPPTAVSWQSWGHSTLDAQALYNRIAASDFETLAFTGVANSRLVAGPRAVDPETVHEYASTYGFAAHLDLGSDAEDGAFDLFVTRAGSGAVPKWPSPTQRASYCNDPVEKAACRRIAASMRRALAESLPEYMLPANCTVLAHLPRNAHGKLDRAALPPPEAADDAPIRKPIATPLQQVVSAAWDEVLGARMRSLSDDFFRSGGTSLAAVQLASALRARDFPISPQDVFSTRTIENMAALLSAARVERAAPDAPAQPDQSYLAERPAQRRASARGVPSALQSATHVLLTGATGMLGAHLLRELLRSTAATIVCLVRGDSAENAVDRLWDAYDWHFPGERPATARVVPVAGDLGLDGLVPGLNEHRLLTQCEHVLHAAADVRHVGDPSQIMSANRDGVERLLALCRESRAAFHHVSTIGVAGLRMPQGAVWALDEADKSAGGIHVDPYSRSKAAGEEAVMRHLAAGYAGSVHRIGTVAPNFVTGRFQRNIDAHFFSRFLRAIVELGYAAEDRERRFRLVPADTMAAAVVALASRAGVIGPVFHIDSPHALSMDDLLAALAASGYAVESLSSERFAARMKQDVADYEKAQALSRMAPLTDRGGMMPVPINALQTYGWLEELDVGFPTPGREYIGRFVEFAVEIGYLPVRTRI